MSTAVSRSAIILWVLTTLFGARVLGQALVAFLDVTGLPAVAWLPAMDAWYSGLLPYPVLLPVQIVILVVQIVINRDVRRRRGFFAQEQPRVGRALRWLAFVYALSMVARSVITRAHPIPIAFHWVLAAYVFALGRFA